MGGFGKARAWLAAVLVFLGGALLLIPSQASAQFNIEGMIRGAIGGYHGGGGYYRYHSSRHYSRREVSHHSRHERDDEGEASDKNKEKDATKDEAASANAGSHAPPSGGSGDVGHSEPTAAPQKPASSSTPSDDQPAFAPAR